jgi:hypothetical protein
MREAEIVDAQEVGKYGKGKRGSDLPDEFKRREYQHEKLCQARLDLEAETAAVAARERQEQAAEAEEAAQKALKEERQKLHTQAGRARERGETRRELAMEKAEQAWMEPSNLEPRIHAETHNRVVRPAQVRNHQGWAWFVWLRWCSNQ